MNMNEFQARLDENAKVDQRLWRDIGGLWGIVEDLQADLEALGEKVHKMAAFAAMPVVARVC
jgi:hypothetical protein